MGDIVSDGCSAYQEQPSKRAEFAQVAREAVERAQQGGAAAAELDVGVRLGPHEDQEIGEDGADQGQEAGDLLEGIAPLLAGAA